MLHKSLQSKGRLLFLFSFTVGLDLELVFGKSLKVVGTGRAIKGMGAVEGLAASCRQR